MKTFAWILLFVEVALVVWLYDKYPTPMLMGSVSIGFFLVGHFILKNIEEKKKILAVGGVVALILFVGMAFFEPSTVVFVGATGDGTLTPPNFWHGLVAAILQYFMLIGGLWAWHTAEISEFLTKQRL